MVPADWKTLGQVISFDITELAAQRYAIAIVSKPAFPALRVDFGKNLENIEKVSEFLLQKSKSNS
jgi:hypothetical protein